MKIEVIETRTEPTVKISSHGKEIIFHSKYDPIHEATVWATNATANIKDNMDIWVVGLSAGYHITALTTMKTTATINIIEFNEEYYNWFMSSSFYQVLSQKKNINILNFDSLSQSEKKNLFQTISSTNILIHKNGLDTMPVKYNNVKILLEDIKLQKDSITRQLNSMDENFQKNIQLKDAGIGKLKNSIKEKSMILVSAGPSLNKQVPLLKIISGNDNFVIGAVGTSLKTLLNNEIMPNFVMITDSQPTTMQQLPADLSSLKHIPLFYLSTAYHETTAIYNGPRKIIWQQGYVPAEKMASLKGDPIIQTGGSVATTLLDTMVFLGAHNIAVVGQDLAFTDGKSHATDSPYQININEQREDKKVINYYQNGYVYTAKNLNMYRTWFEQYANEHIDLRLYNCTEGGAFINNWEHIDLNEFYLKFKK